MGRCEGAELRCKSISANSTGRYLMVSKAEMCLNPSSEFFSQEEETVLEDWLRNERPQIRRPISFLEERVIMMEGKLGELVRLIIREVEEERRQRIRMGWALAVTQGITVTLLLLLWRRSS